MFCGPANEALKLRLTVSDNVLPEPAAEEVAELSVHWLLLKLPGAAGVSGPSHVESASSRSHSPLPACRYSTRHAPALLAVPFSSASTLFRYPYPFTLEYRKVNVWLLPVPVFGVTASAVGATLCTAAAFQPPSVVHPLLSPPLSSALP